MKALITAAVLSAVVIASTQASAHHRYYRYVVRGPIYAPTATCVTHATKAPLPEYVCCEKDSSRGRDLWADTWVSGGCKMVPGAHKDLGCTINSPVYGTGAPINAQCQFSYTTGMLEQGHRYTRFYYVYR